MKKVAFLLVATVIVLSACESEGEKPEIDFHELGYENSKTAEIGDELHMDAEIVAENKIDKIEIELHPEEDGHGHEKGAAGESDEEWEFEKTYTEFSGLKNTEFHEHIEIPAEAHEGHYHFHFKVTDMEGYQTVFEDEVELVAPAGK
jgi:hypothetical protein